MVIGKGGAEIEKLQAQVSKMIGKPVALSIVEVRTPDTNAQLVAEKMCIRDSIKVTGSAMTDCGIAICSYAQSSEFTGNTVTDLSLIHI